MDQFFQSKMALIEAKVARLTAEQRNLVESHDLLHEASMHGTEPKHVVVRGSFPWGSQWCWGFQFLRGKLYIHNPFVKIGPRISKFSAPGITIGEGEWGVVCDVDWAMYGVGGYEFKTVTSQADMTEELENEPDGSTSSERIPVAWFNDATLVLDYIHGMPYPHVLAGYYP